VGLSRWIITKANVFCVDLGCLFSVPVEEPCSAEFGLLSEK
jgi:hypothetical protein